MRAEDVADLLPHVTEQEKVELDRFLARDDAPWRPQPGPQSLAYSSLADITGYGGAAGSARRTCCVG